MRRSTGILLAGVVGIAAARAVAGGAGCASTLLSAGRPVLFAPAPGYSLTRRGGTDARDLTDGKLTRRPDKHMWLESLAVGWSYAGRVNLALDLGRTAVIDEIAIRFLGGSPQHGISFPGWVEALVSDDGEHFRTVADFSRWRAGELHRFGVPDDAGQAWVHRLRFTGLQARGRWVGIRFYGTGLTCSDELYVYGRPLDDPAPPADRAGASGFTVTHPQPHFHKPRLVVIAEVPAPIPVGIVVPGSLPGAQAVGMVLDLPAGVTLAAGTLGGTDLAKIAPRSIPPGYHRYAFTASATASTKTWGRLFVRAPGLRPGWRGSLRYRFTHGAWQSPLLSVPLEVVGVPAVPRPSRLLTSLGWWSASSSVKWPDVLKTWRHLGLNGFPLFGHWMPRAPSAPEWKLLEEARRQGFFIVNIDSPFHRLLARRKNEAEIYCQFGANQHGLQLCPSYRGRFYREEIQRLADQCRQVRPDFMALDIELWSWRGPLDSRRCLRCRADFSSRMASDLGWEAWQQEKGLTMWCDLVDAARAAARKAGGRRIDVGGYDFRPGQAYQHTWPFDRLYPERIGESQVSTYTCLYPYHLGVIGDEVRADRARLPRSDVMPWITPGDAGTFPGEAFRWALLECFVNGARGIYFWSGRVWDAESLAALAGVIRALAPVEEVIAGGELAGGAVAVAPPGRVSGLKRDGEMVLLVADYFGRGPGRLRLTVDLAGPSAVVDLDSGRTLIEKREPGRLTFTVLLGGARARLLHVKPLSHS